MSQKLLFIFNPHAGKGQIKNHLVDIVDMMVKAGFDVTIYTTQAQQMRRARWWKRVRDMTVLSAVGVTEHLMK